MKSFTVKPLFSALSLSFLLLTGGFVSAGEPLTLKQTMKEMRLHYKEALETRSPESFNQHLDKFKVHLTSAKAYEFSPERKVISLEGLTKVDQIVSALPVATSENLLQLQKTFEKVDDLRTEYHKKAKPGPWELFLSIFK